MRNYGKSIGIMVLASMLALLLAACGGGGGGGGGSVSSTPPAAGVTTANEVTFSPPIGTPLPASSTLAITFPAAVDTGTASINVAGSWNSTNTVYTISSATIAAASMVSVTVSAVSATDTAHYAADNVNYNVYGGSNPYLYVSTAGSDTSGNGSLTAPFATIAKAMSVATAGQAVLVARGTYDVDSGGGTGITMKDGVSLYGGYSANFSTRNPAANVTTIRDTATAATASLAATDYGTTSTGCWFATPGAPMAPITVNSLNTTSQTMFIDGFTVKASANASTTDSAAIDVLLNYVRPGSLTIGNSRLDGGAGSAMSAGIYATNGTYILYSDTINGGTSANLSTGVYTGAGGSSVRYDIVRYSDIDGGAGASVNIAMFNDALGNIYTDVRYSVLNGGGGAHSYGAYNSPNCPAWTYPVLVGDSINGGSGAQRSTGVYALDYVDLDIFNSTIDGGSGNSGTGVWTADYAGPVNVWNDTVSGGSGAASSVAATATTSASLNVENSILFTTAASSSICLNNDGSAALTAKNNDLTTCPTLYSYNGTGVNSVSATTTINGSSTTLAATGNVSMAPAFASATNWHLTSNSPADVQQGGLDLTGVAGYNINMPGDDKDGKKRTAVLTLSTDNNGAAGISMGAYER